MIDDYLIDCAVCLICFISFLSQLWLTIRHFYWAFLLDLYFYSDHFD